MSLIEFISSAFSVLVSVDGVEFLHGGIDGLIEQRLQRVGVTQSLGQGKEADQGNVVVLFELGNGWDGHAAHHREGLAEESLLQPVPFYVLRQPDGEFVRRVHNEIV